MFLVAVGLVGRLIVVLYLVGVVVDVVAISKVMFVVEQFGNNWIAGPLSECFVR